MTMWQFIEFRYPGYRFSIKNRQKKCRPHQDGIEQSRQKLAPRAEFLAYSPTYRAKSDRSLESPQSLTTELVERKMAERPASLP